MQIHGHPDKQNLHGCHEQYLRHHRANQPPLQVLQVSLMPLKQKQYQLFQFINMGRIEGKWKHKISFPWRYIKEIKSTLIQVLAYNSFHVTNYHSTNITTTDLKDKKSPGFFSHGLRTNVLPHVTAIGNICKNEETLLTGNSHLRPRLLKRIGLGRTIHYIEGIFKEEIDDTSLFFSKLKVMHEEKLSLLILPFCGG